MGFNIGCILTKIKDMSREKTIAVDVGGLLIGSIITHGEMISAISSIIMKTVEIGVGMWQINIIIDPNAQLRIGEI